jgi:hypothetical protein
VERLAFMELKSSVFSNPKILPSGSKMLPWAAPAAITRFAIANHEHMKVHRNVILVIMFSFP